MRAVFLDRDGVVNALVYHSDAGVIDSPFSVEQFRLLPRVPHAIRVLNDLGFAVVIASNQPGIAKRRFSEKTLRMVERKMLAQLKPAGARIDRIYYCFHHPQAEVKSLRRRCDCRKPGIGMLKRAATDLGLRLEECYMVGDGIPDLLAGARAGCRTIFVGRWKCEICQFLQPEVVWPDWVVSDIWEASQVIKAETAPGRGPKARLRAQPTDRGQAPCFVMA